MRDSIHVPQAKISQSQANGIIGHSTETIPGRSYVKTRDDYLQKMKKQIKVEACGGKDYREMSEKLGFNGFILRPKVIKFNMF